ncbi:MAG: ABC transporter substrate-binding protein [Rhodospirillales bacterium]|jgi:phospholipid transport system substrate-binding protein|nr:ABC transporter substrate-binding protein [Rhodospirillales bacterium]
MHNRPIRSILTVAVLLAAFAAAWPVFANGTPESLIEGLADKAIASLTERDITREERVSRFRTLLNDHFDVRTIGRWVLGRHWRSATPAEREEYFTLFEDLIVFTYVDRFTKYSGEALAVTGAKNVDEKDTLVSSEITRADAGSPPLRVDWRLRARDDGYRIVDVMVQGISMGQTQRSEFASVIRTNGGTIEALLEKLRARPR